MKHYLTTAILIILLFNINFWAQAKVFNSDQKSDLTIVSIDQSRTLAVNLLSRCGSNHQIASFSELADEEGTLIARVFHLIPEGYIVAPVYSFLQKVIAYSFESNFGESGSENPLYQMIKLDIKKKCAMYSEYPDLIYSSFSSEDSRTSSDKCNRLDQWPAVGDGWLKTNWTQTAPYNDLCPMDPVTQLRSYAGCPSVAMAMILDFHQCTNNTVFDDSFDYYHSYAGRNYQIDDDFETVGFASFPQLTNYLDSLNTHWQTGQLLTDTDKAALVFACGVACTQVYTSEGSGTFGVDQALGAYEKFGFNMVSLLDENDPDLWDRLKQNIMDTLPAHLAVVDQAWQTGHNVVVDGYNTDDYYHINFGWGGVYNGWYLLPDEMPMGLTVVEGIVLDIMKDTTTSVTNIADHQNCTIYPNPSSSMTCIRFNNSEKLNHTLIIYNLSGKVIETITDIIDDKICINNTNRSSGLYFFKLRNTKGDVTSGKYIFL